MNRHHRRQAKDADRILARLAQMDARMSAASDALMKGLADLSAKLASQVSDIEAARAQAEAAQAAKDEATFAEANEKVKTMLANLGPHVEAIGQMAAAVADGSGISVPAAVPPAVDVATASPEMAVQANPAVAAPSSSAEAADATPASSSAAPASNEATGDVVPSDGDASAEDAAATGRRKR